MYLYYFKFITEYAVADKLIRLLQDIDYKHPYWYK